MSTITFDVTGFYYQKTYTGEAAQLFVGKSVRQLTEMTQGRLGDDARGRLARVDFDSSGFLHTLEVDFTADDSADPKSRQVNANGSAPSFGANPPTGVYGYSDKPSNVIPGVDVTFTPVWQYYLFDANGRLKSGRPVGAPPTERRIIPADQSNQVTPLELGDRLVWRVVLIGGIRERLTQMRDQHADPSGFVAGIGTGTARAALTV